MEIFWRVLLGHFLADFTFQTNWINAVKRSSIWGMILHAGMHPVLYAVLAWPYLDRLWVNTRLLQMTGWTCVMALFIIHFLEDEWRVFTIDKFHAADNTLFFTWDQVIHYASIVLLVPLGADAGPGAFPEKWPVIAILFILATHFTTVLIYFLEKDLWGGAFPGDTEKYLGIAERLVVTMSFLLPGQWWVPVTGCWAAYRLMLRRKRIQDFTWLNFSVSGSMALLCGLGARVVYYS
jgi:hypothetical protein